LLIYILGPTSENHRLLVKHAEELWKFLEIVIGTKEEVQMRRDIMELYEEVKNIPHQLREYISGSSKEGFQFYWSDLDVMISFSYCNVVIQDKGCSNTKCVYIATDTDCQPGFCKLLPYCSKNVDDSMWISRIDFLNERMKCSINSNDDVRSKGPCITTTYAVGFDMCYAFPIDPISSNEFLQRFPAKFWKNIKSEILKENATVMHVVPKGPPIGDTKGIQWLKSFAVLEQRIVHSLIHVQFCCYGLLKILIYFEIDAYSETSDTLSSYHLKTVLFHVLEDIHPDFWIPGNILYCFWICLTRLVLYVKKGVCPSYFVPECNLFLKTGFFEKKCQVQKKLLQILRSGACDVLAMTESLYITNPLLLPKSTKLRTFLTFSSSLQHVKGHQTTYHECMHSILKVMHIVVNEKNDFKRAILNYLFAILMRRAGVILYDKYVLYGFIEYLLTAAAAFSLARHSDASGSLYLATFWYCQGKFKYALKLLSEVLKKLPDECLLHPHILHYSSLLSDISKPSCTFTDLMRNHYSGRIHLDRGSNFFPKVLENDVRKSIISEYSMCDKSYTLFLMFLCYLETHQRNKCVKTLSRLRNSFENPRFKSSHWKVQDNSRRLAAVAESKMMEIN
jgi:hypothetical protein